MLKLLGALIVIVASTAYGFYRAMIYGKRLEQLKQLIYSLKRLKTDIQFGLTPLPEAFLHIGSQMSAPFGQFYIRLSERLIHSNSEVSFTAIWNDELNNASYDSYLTKQQYDILLQLGTVLGTSDVEDQQQHLQTAIERLILEESVASEEQVKYASLWRSLGALLGVALVILLI